MGDNGEYKAGRTAGSVKKPNPAHPNYDGLHIFIPRITEEESAAVSKLGKILSNTYKYAYLEPRHQSPTRRTPKAEEDPSNTSLLREEDTSPVKLSEQLRMRLPLEPEYNFYSRNYIEEEIMNALKDKDVKVIGICGMGGIGKTTIARQLMNRVQMEETLFDEIVMVVVSYPIHILKFQRDIAESLGLAGFNELTSQEDRASQLSKRLSMKSVLLVLDDIWEAIPLEDLGIPVPPKGCCTLLLTSRDIRVMDEMNADEVFYIGTLDEDKALSLLKSTIGTCANDPSLTDIVEEVARECQGLPLSICTIGNALRDQEKNIWENTLRQLRHASNSPTEVIHPNLELSFNHLEPKGQLLFLLCSIYPQDFVIELEDLVSYAMGLKMFEGIHNLEEARDVVMKAVDLLKSRFFLLDCGYGNQVTIHDILRDFGYSMALEKGLIERRESDCIIGKWTYLLIGKEKSDFDHFSEINLLESNLLIIYSHSLSEISDISFLKRMPNLNVLSLRNISFKTLPEGIQLLKDLRSLILVGCRFETLCPVGALQGLEIFKCCECHLNEELPIEIGMLTHLKLLDLSDCEKLKRIPRGIISNLTQLEELKMLNSFKKWERSIMVTKVNGRNQNAMLKELELLKKLRRLEIEIEDTYLIEEEILLPPQLSAYKICIGGGLLNHNVEKALSVRRLSTTQKIGKWMLELVGTTQAHSTIMELGIPSCGESSSSPTRFNANPNQHASFSYLGSLEINECHELQNLFLLERAKEVFLCLEILVIEDCRKMERVFILNGNNNDEIISSITFPRLKRLRLVLLPSLTTIWKGMKSIELPSLGELEIIQCNQLKSVVSATEKHICDEECDGGEPHFFCAHMGKFNKLEGLCIQNCDGIASLFSSSATENLRSLKRLEINQCRNMEKVITGKKRGNLTLFPALEVLKIENMQSLKWICKWDCTLTLPLLGQMTTVGCPNMRMLTSGSLITESLCKFRIDHKIQKKFEKGENLDYVYYLHIETTSETSKLSGTSTPSKTVGSIPQKNDALPPITSSSEPSETPSRFKEHHEELQNDPEHEIPKMKEKAEHVSEALWKTFGENFDALMGQNEALISDKKELMQRNNDLVNLNEELLKKNDEAMNQNKELMQKYTDVMNQNKELMHHLMEQSKELMRKSNELLMAQMEDEKEARKKLQESMDCMVKTIEGFKEAKI